MKDLLWGRQIADSAGETYSLSEGAAMQKLTAQGPE